MKYKKLLFLLLMILLAVYMIGAKTYDYVIQRLALAIKKKEGYFPGSKSFKNNNPGNLIFANQKGSIGQDLDGFAIFPDYETGWNALIRQLELAFYGGSSIYNADMTLYQFFNYWDETDPVGYAEYVANELGVSPLTTLRELS